MIKTRTKILTAFLGITTVMLLAVSAMPEQAHAQAGGILGCGALGGAGLAAGAGAGGIAATAAPSGLPVTDKALTAIQSANLVATTKIAADSSTQSLVTCMLNGLAWTVAKMTIQSITRSTVNWINSGFQGSPAFISDLNANLSVLSDTVANNFFQQLNQVAIDATGFNLTSPFQDQITQRLRQEYYQTTGSLLGLNQYDLQGHSADPRAFLSGNFSQGGFNAFFSASQNPANNPFGAYQIASNALWGQIDAAARQRNAEYIVGKGFSAWRGNCTQPSSTVKLAKADQCLGSPIRTPGAVIEAQLENNLGTGIRQLELADSINEIVGALMGQLVNQVLGPNGLLGVSQPSAGGGSSYINQATSASQNDAQTTSLAGGVVQTIANDISAVTTFRDNWQKILDAANAAQVACGARSDITDVITQATAGVARGNTALQRETTVNTSIQAALTSTSVDASTQITTALTQYQSFLGATTTPSSTDEAYAATQSTDTSGGDSGSTPSLYTQMVNAKNSCVAST